MPKVTLTARSVAALTSNGSAQLDYFDAVVPGLVLRAGKGGRKVYAVRYRLHGTHRRLKLGEHPHLTLADARKRAREAIAAAQAGEDPAELRRIRRSKDATFAALAAEFLDARGGRATARATQRERKRIMESELLPQWRNRAACAIARRDVAQLVGRIRARGADVMANRVLATIKAVFNYGLDVGFPGLEGNPAARMKGTEEEPRDRYLTREEIRAVWLATAWEGPIIRTLFRMALLTAQRVGSVCALRWSDIDDADVWRIPREVFKGKRPHLVPLSAEALTELAELRKLTGGMEYAFPGRSDGKVPHITSLNKARERLRKRADIPDWSPHDFRRTFRTHATRSASPSHPRDPVGLGVPPNIADVVLGHVEASIGARVYTADVERYLLAEKRDALTQWGTFVRFAVDSEAAR